MRHLVKALLRRKAHKHEQHLAKKILNPHLYRPPYVGRHAGRDFLVVCSGPSLGSHGPKISAFINDHRPIIISTNSVPSNIQPDYRVFTHRGRFIHQISQLDPDASQALLSPYFPEWLIRKHYSGRYEQLMYVSDNEAPFAIKDGIIQTSCRSSGLLCIGVALVMGARRVFVVGMDGYSSFLNSSGAINYDTTRPKHAGNSEANRVHYATLQEYHVRFLMEINNYMRQSLGERLRILTPTDYQTYYDDISDFAASS